MVAARIFVGLVVVAGAFQIARLAGAPWGHLTQGRRRSGRLPTSGRAVAAVSLTLATSLVVALT